MSVQTSVNINQPIIQLGVADQIIQSLTQLAGATLDFGVGVKKNTSNDKFVLPASNSDVVLGFVLKTYKELDSDGETNQYKDEDDFPLITKGIVGVSSAVTTANLFAKAYVILSGTNAGKVTTVSTNNQEVGKFLQVDGTLAKIILDI